MVWELCAHILHFLMLKQYLSGVYAFILKKAKGGGGGVGNNFFWKSQS